jgi:hypothetical protein
MTRSDDRKSPHQFQAAIRADMLRFRSALGEATAGVGADPTRPQALARRLGLDKSLAWHLSKILAGGDALATVPHLPGRAGLQIVLASFERAGAASLDVDALRDAIAALERTIDTHCGDRATLEMMLGSSQANGSAAREEAQRKQLFQGASAVWGVQARVHLSAHFVAPSAGDDDLLDTAVLSGLVDFVRLRPDVPWAVATVRRFTGEGVTAAPGIVEPVDPGVDPAGAPLLREFCSHPLPELRVAAGAPGTTRYEIVEGPVGHTAACTCVTAWIDRRCVSRWRTPDDRFGEHLVHICTPAKLLVHDLFIHRDLPFELPPQLGMYGMLPGGPEYPHGGRDQGKLAVTVGVIDLGASPPDVTMPEMPRYPKMIETAFRRLGAGPEDFHGYRMRLRFPPIPALAAMRYPLLEPAGA